jgi:hypothetical protein
MMEQWHQKLHNNTSPDDVVICEALLAYLAADLDVKAYWDTLHVRLESDLTRVACGQPWKCRALDAEHIPSVDIWACC